MKKIRVLLADDTPLALNNFQCLMSDVSDIEFLACACDSAQALELIARHEPDVLCADYLLASRDGQGLLRKIMLRHPLPILVARSSAQLDGEQMRALLAAGALDCVGKPQWQFTDEQQHAKQEFISKIRIIAGVHVFRKSPRSIAAAPAALPVSSGLAYRLLVIGASTGGPEALAAVLKQLPADFPLPIVCVQHISDGFLHSFMVWLSEKSGFRCSAAQDGARPTNKQVYFPQEKRQLEFDAAGRFLIGSGHARDGHCPSVSSSMQSAAERYGASVIAVLLTGMGNDGAAGMLAVRQAGGMTIAQDAASSVVFGMPAQAIELGAAKMILPLRDIAAQLISLCRSPVHDLT
ncbi:MULTISPECIES: chemotaxis protein CheB [unclassified Undibacterium]|uniref:chemotaxis protein CheB n=1 Tax=unclassified Undibacterium TaxID=2630295 RepID=UPI002AC9230A|nr:MULTISPECIES: chemotaxis protein CheB [unclassified Undibacterium]MEB0138617.1 chemotaxis protein CheB [Undibacterium sp. CCC2.1]MEB0171418.1 chemotaxis protein CheB [Undibacterium sp. CCC1.1]MEB0175748.1 chemotaxis protein CheB [Undibacterium sp. CCC3.4]MEB0214424.1 chemotaxis protein CheB [Undibacterium sp. 5I2]WPX44289.1 chemotaxis protein CheB [Undibacterium sp. CCC3.4]